MDRRAFIWVGVLCIASRSTILGYRGVEEKVDVGEGGYKSNGCDYFEGSWVYSDSYPLYAPGDCPFIGFNCLDNGRPDQDYLKFNGEDFLERNRGKSIMFVGDSLSNNMWQSLTCMLHTAVPNSNFSLTQSGKLSTFSFPEFGVSIMFLQNGFLVDLAYEKIGKVLKLDSISSGDQWKADTLIFNTYHWWIHTGRFKTWDYFQVGNKIVEEMDRMEAFKIAITTWSKWVDSNVDTSKTKVFYQGVSAFHFKYKLLTLTLTKLTSYYQ
ncbi:hypothetical protein FEM48_Zijuj12G0121700 [Ziziphus jujuba var. spinosa]|uniref:Trichome birefringence-like C-terminal domain-containing protein n=1 Tax=Ziziphus jujuba var. spinosa TaxID=714518 RepID=A0A978UD89_ZIZJJ|nr:hypothetical protein FEM48_Zijuj12G0121700 [Ziziphus jujuba var. spinosa]